MKRKTFEEFYGNLSIHAKPFLQSDVVMSLVGDAFHANDSYIDSLEDKIRKQDSTINKYKEQVEHLENLFDGEPIHWSNVIYDKNKELDEKDKRIAQLEKTCRDLREGYEDLSRQMLAYADRGWVEFLRDEIRRNLERNKETLEGLG